MVFFFFYDKRIYIFIKIQRFEWVVLTHYKIKMIQKWIDKYLKKQ
jgi:hypothetical protein